MLARLRKALVAALGGLAAVAATVTLPSPYQEIAVAVLAIATAAGVYRVPNSPAAK